MESTRKNARSCTLVRIDSSVTGVLLEFTGLRLVHIGICDTLKNGKAPTTPATEQALLADGDDGEVAEEEVELAGRDGSGRRKLAKNRRAEYSGAGTTKQYKYWKRSANLTTQLRGPTDQELTLLVVSQLMGTAKDCVDILGV